MQKQLPPKAPKHSPSLFITRGILIASIAFASLLPLTGCSSSKDASRDDNMGDSKMLVKKPEPKSTESSPLKNVYSKADTSQGRIVLSPRARVLAEQRLKEIRKELREWEEKTDSRGFYGNLPREKKIEALEMSGFCVDELELYTAALEAKSYSEIEKLKQGILDRGKLFGYPEYANKIIQRFDETVSAK